VSEERTIQRLSESLLWIEKHFGLYNQRRLDYRRGNLPTNSLPEHVAGSSEPAMPEEDDLDKRVNDGWRKIRAHLETARVALRGAESEMAYLVNATKRPDDPTPRACANPGCLDTVIYSMIGKDHPPYSDGRCRACHMYLHKYQRDRGFKNYELVDGVEVAG
jgi:hypothetical protein